MPYYEEYIENLDLKYGEIEEFYNDKEHDAIVKIQEKIKILKNNKKSELNIIADEIKPLKEANNLLIKEKNSLTQDLDNLKETKQNNDITLLKSIEENKKIKDLQKNNQIFIKSLNNRINDYENNSLKLKTEEKNLKMQLSDHKKKYDKKESLTMFLTAIIVILSVILMVIFIQINS